MSDPAPGPALAAIQALAAANGLDPALPPACEAEARTWAAAPGIDDPALADLTALAFVTIDNPDSRDLDQALFVEDDGDGHVVWYALADASHFVRPGSALWAEGLRRGATVYLPGLIAPMLPRLLCEDLVSLGPQVDRRAMVFQMHVDASGRAVRTHVHRARVRSRAKLSYEGVQAWLDGGPPPTADAAALASLRRLVAVGERRLAEAESRNVLRFHRTEVSVSLAGEGLRFIAAGEPRNDVERYNEQISLLANIEGARLLQAAGDHSDVQPIFRTHEPPQAQMLVGFAEQVETLVAAHGLDPALWAWDPAGPESLASYIRRLPLDDPSHGGIARAIQTQAMRTGGRSDFRSLPGRHFGVGAEVYSRFTAPMREVVGIFVHKELWEALGVQPPTPREADLADQAAVLAVTRGVRQRQRKLDGEVNRLVLDRLFERDLTAATPPSRPATVLGLGQGKVYVRLADPPIEVKAYAVDLAEFAGEGRRVDPAQATVWDDAGEAVFRVGDEVSVRVGGLDETRDRWKLALTRPGSSGAESA